MDDRCCLTKPIILLLCTAFSSACSLNMDVWVPLVADVQHFYHTGCVFLVDLATVKARSWSSFHSAHFTVKLQKLASLRNTATAVIDDSFLQSQKDDLCQRNQPLNVLLTFQNEDKHVLEAEFRKGRARWLLLSDNSNVEDILRDLYIPLDCEFIVAQPSEEEAGKGMRLNEVYRVSKSSPLNISPWGRWDIAAGLVGNKTSIHGRRRDLQGVQLRAIEYQDFNLENGGRIVPVINILQNMFNFSRVHLNISGLPFGSPDANGSWNGLIGYLQRGDADIYLDYFLMSNSRLDVMAFSMPLIITRTRAYIRQPEETDWSLTVYTAPLSYAMWTAILVSILVLSLVADAVQYVGRHFIPYYDNQPFFVTFSDILHYILGVFCSQGHWTTPQPWSGRLLYLTCCLLIIILWAAYSATLVAHLAIRTPPPLPFTSLQGLLDDGSYRFTVRKSGAHLQYFKSTTDPVLRDTYLRHLKPNADKLPGTFVSGLEEVCQGRVVFLGLEVTFNTMRKYLDCYMVHLPELSFPAEILAIGLPKNSPYKNIILHGFHHLRPSGIWHKFLDDLWLSKETYVFETPLRGIPIGKIIPVLALWALAVMIAIFIFAFQKLHHMQVTAKQH